MDGYLLVCTLEEGCQYWALLIFIGPPPVIHEDDGYYGHGNASVFGLQMRGGV